MGNLEVWQLALIVVFTIHLVQSGFWRGKAKQRADVLVFGANPPMRLLGSVGGLIYVWGLVDQLIAAVRGQPHSIYYVGLFTALLFLTLLGWPKSIRLSSSEIAQRRALRKSVHITYTSIASITFDMRARDTTVYSDTGDMIIHSSLHVDRDRFQAEVVMKSGQRLELIR
jgi:hypothetical protein